ncbi:hypothetical protein HPP92_002317 [Vanilla planifolia]|uniref:RING-type E3 ubiquitin transferase n=1 Tax=Vanilla planifolia TaxID=51239 RepID=A0A835S010_VANPL|nr:hypothetical protein HPP92_002317 [Vanilla planifolia]
MALRSWIFSSVRINYTDCVQHCDTKAFPPLSHPPPSRISSSSSGHRLVAHSVIAAITVAVAVFFLSLTYYIVLARRRRSDHLPNGGDSRESAAEDPNAEYHVWHVHTIGLDESTISSIAVKPFLASEGVAVADCSVCLSEFRDGELVRLLPVCGHAFHVPCIDEWLREHVNCPLCRSHIVDPVDSVLVPEGNSVISDPRESQEDEEDGSREGITLTVTDSSLDCVANHSFRSSGDLMEIVSQSEQRCSSMDSSPSNFLVVSVDREEVIGAKKREKDNCCFDEGQVQEETGWLGNCSTEYVKQKSSAELEGGSTSGIGKVLFFSRYGRPRSSLILPL